MVVEITNTERSLSDTEVRELLAEGLGPLDLEGRRVLVVIPDGTRTAPIGLFFGLLGDLLGSKVEALDYLIALGTHPPMDDAAKGTLLEAKVVDGTVRVERHRGYELAAKLMESFSDQIEAITVGKPTLEDVFVHETGHRFEGSQEE